MPTFTYRSYSYLFYNVCTFRAPQHLLQKNAPISRNVIPNFDSRRREILKFLGPHCKKKVGGFPVPNRESRCHQPNFPWPKIIKLFPGRESFVSDIPAGDGKITNLFLQCTPRKPRISITYMEKGYHVLICREKLRNSKCRRPREWSL